MNDFFKLKGDWEFLHSIEAQQGIWNHFSGLIGNPCGFCFSVQKSRMSFMQNFNHFKFIVRYQKKILELLLPVQAYLNRFIQGGSPEWKKKLNQEKQKQKQIPNSKPKIRLPCIVLKILNYHLGLSQPSHDLLKAMGEEKFYFSLYFIIIYLRNDTCCHHVLSPQCSYRVLCVKCNIVHSMSSHSIPQCKLYRDPSKGKVNCRLCQNYNS